MPSLTTTIEENSPLITYLSDWVTGTSASDNLASSYSESSFMATQIAGASASFVFNGTGVQIFGAKRGNHGPYSVKVDDTVYTTVNGLVPDPGVFQQSLFGLDGLQQGRHEVTITNQGTTFLDVDFITWVTNIGNPSDKLFVNTVQDTDSSFVYSSGSAWNTNPKKVGSFMGGSGHATTNAGASLVYTFQAGEGVSLYGPVSPDGAPYKIQLDGGQPQNLNSNQQMYKSQVLLYHANTLSPGQHRLKLTCQPTVSGQSCAVDYANVYTTTQPQSMKEGGLSAGSIAGIVLSMVGIFGVLVGLSFLLRRRQRRLKHHKEIPRPYVTDKPVSNDEKSRVVTISSFGPGPSTSDLNTGENLMPIPFRSSPSIRSQSGLSALYRPGPVKQQVRFSEYTEQRDPAPTRTPSPLPGLLLQPNRRPPSPLPRLNSKRSLPGLPATPAPISQNKGCIGAHFVNDTPAGGALEQAPLAAGRKVEGRAQLMGAVPESDARLSLVSVPPAYQWATRVRPYAGP